MRCAIMNANEKDHQSAQKLAKKEFAAEVGRRRVERLPTTTHCAHVVAQHHYDAHCIRTAVGAAGPARPIITDHRRRARTLAPTIAVVPRHRVPALRTRTRGDFLCAFFRVSSFFPASSVSSSSYAPPQHAVRRRARLSSLLCRVGGAR